MNKKEKPSAETHSVNVSFDEGDNVVGLVPRIMKEKKERIQKLKKEALAECLVEMKARVQEAKKCHIALQELSQLIGEANETGGKGEGG